MVLEMVELTAREMAGAVVETTAATEGNRWVLMMAAMKECRWDQMKGRMLAGQMGAETGKLMDVVMVDLKARSTAETMGKLKAGRMVAETVERWVDPMAEQWVVLMATLQVAAMVAQWVIKMEFAPVVQ